MKIAVTGYNGRLGSELVKLGCIPFSCDVSIKSTIEVANNLVKPDILINCAAKTGVDRCETDDEYFALARKVNFWGIVNLREVLDCPIIHISTDYVLAGNKGPYAELTDYDPINAYAMTKCAGEVGFLYPYTDGDLVVRVTGLYGSSRVHDDFARVFLSCLRSGTSVKVTKDLRGNHTYIPHLAEALIYVANNLESITRRSHILNIASLEVVSRYEFACMLAKEFGLDSSVFIPTGNSGIQEWKAKRPTFGGLKVSLAQELGVPIYTIKEGLKRFRENEEG